MVNQELGSPADLVNQNLVCLAGVCGRGWPQGRGGGFASELCKALALVFSTPCYLQWSLQLRPFRRPLCRQLRAVACWLAIFLLICWVFVVCFCFAKLSLLKYVPARWFFMFVSKSFPTFFADRSFCSRVWSFLKRLLSVHRRLFVRI